MARQWGNAAFRRPAPFAPIVAAAGCHDEGWRAWEDAPGVSEGAPINFTQIDRATHVALYREAIADARRRDPRTGLLVSMHGQRLYEGRGGLDPEPPPPRASRPPVVRGFLREQDRLQRELERAIGAGPDLDAWASAGYRLLQTWDALSLHLTWNGLLTGRTITLPQVPRDAGDAGVDLEVRPGGEMSCSVEPWPFQDDLVELPVLARMIDDRPYEDALDLVESLGRASWFTLAFRVHPA